jgi:hypothetical protein
MTTDAGDEKPVQGGAVNESFVQLDFDWSPASSLPAFAATLFLVTLASPEEGVLSIGQVPYPLHSEVTPDEQRQAMQRLGRVPVNPLAKLSLNRQAVRNLVEVLSQLGDQMDELSASGSGSMRADVAS